MKTVSVDVIITKTFAVEITDGELVEDAKQWVLDYLCGEGEVEVVNALVAKDDLQADSFIRNADEILTN